MTPEQQEISYKASRDAAAGHLPRIDAIKLIAASGIPDGSAKIFLEVFTALRRGAVFKRALSEADMDRCLSGILADDGSAAHLTALNAFARHISYRESVGHTQRGNRALYARHLALVTVPDATATASSQGDGGFVEEVQKLLTDAPAARQERLRSSNPVPRLVPRVVYVFERNPDVVAEALVQAAGVCGNCQNPAPFTRASDGSPYLEVHHRKPLAAGGQDTAENAVALCPNCHREAHFG